MGSTAGLLLVNKPQFLFQPIACHCTTWIEPLHLLFVQSLVNGMTYTSNTCDISISFDHYHKHV
jgi:hypothetical protein